MLPRWMRVRPSWTSATTFVLPWAFALALGLSLVGTMGSVVAQAGRLPSGGVVVLAGFCVVQLVVIGFAVSGFSRAWSDALLVLALAALLVVYVFDPHVGMHDSDGWPTAAVVAVQCWVLAFGGWWRWWLGIPAVMVYASLRLVTTHSLGSVNTHSLGSIKMGVVDLIAGLQLAVLVVVGVRVVQRIAAECDRAERSRREALLVEHRRAAAEARTQEIARFLHDELIHALKAISEERRDCDTDPRELARASLQRLRPDNIGESFVQGEALAPSGDLGARLVALGPRTGISVTVSGRADWVPAHVGNALVGASLEALRNVARHSGVKEARIRVESQRGGVTISISDLGGGFDTETLGDGLRWSIIGRMADVGGQARLSSSPSGSLIELKWAPPEVEDRVSSTWQLLTGALASIVIPYLLGSAIMGLLIASELERGSLLILGLVLILVTASLALSAEQLSRAQCLAIVAVAVAAVALNVLAASADTRNGYHLVLGGGVTPLMMLVVVHLPLRWALACLGVMWGALCGLGWWRFGWETLSIDLFGFLTAPVAVVAILGVKVLITHFGRRALVAQEHLARSQARLEQKEACRRTRNERLRAVRELVTPFLQAVQDGSLELSDPSVTRKARVLEAGLRDEIRLNHRPAEFAARTDAIRQSGWDLDVRVTREDLATALPQLLILLRALDRPPDGSGRAVLSVLNGSALVVRAPSKTNLAHWRGRSDVYLEEGDSWVRLTVHPRTDQPMKPPALTAR